MPDTEATLRDVTTEPNPAPATTQEPVPATTAPAINVQDTEAVALGRALMESGYTQAQLTELLAAPQALQSLRHIIENNPSELVAMLERNNPEAAKRLLEETSDAWLQRNRQFIPPAEGGKSADKNISSELMSEVETLRTELNQVKTREQQRAQQASLAQVQSRYTSRVDDLFNQLPKDLGLTKTDQTALRALLDKELAADAIAVSRVSQGNFVDVPKKFQSIIEGLASDRKAAAEADKTAREAAKRGAHAEFTSGANPFLIDVPAGASDSWDATEEAFGKALERAS